jgi:hypothetical protein
MNRRDIPCMSELCFEGCSHLSSAASEKPTSSSQLPGEAVTHYLIPFTDVVAKFMEVLEVGEFTGSRGRIYKHWCGSGIRCLFDPGSGSEMNIPDHISGELRNNFLG